MYFTSLGSLICLYEHVLTSLGSLGLVLRDTGAHIRQAAQVTSVCYFALQVFVLFLLFFLCVFLLVFTYS